MEDQAKESEIAPQANFLLFRARKRVERGKRVAGILFK
jgi:hypothetical protein